MAEVILFRGRPGVGKTTLTDLLGRQLHLPIIRKDDFYDVVAAYTDSHEQRNQICYTILFRLLETNRVAEGRFILDFPFNRAEEMDRFAEWLRQRDYRLRSVLCICSDERLWAERFNARAQNPLPNQLITEFSKLKAYYKDLSIEPMADELIVDTVEPPDSIIRRVAAFIQA